MTSLLKRGACEDAQALEWRAAAAPTPLAPEPDPIAEELSLLRAEVASLHQELTKAEEKLLEEIALAREEGRRDAEAAWRRDEAAALEKLEGGIAQALAIWAERLIDLDIYAGLLANTALTGVFERTDGFRTLMGEAIAKQIAGLRQDTIVRVFVSTSDLANPEALDILSQRLGACEIVQDTTLEAGVCRIDLRLGHIELSLPRYWQEVQALLKSSLTETAP